jgi:hypothetical protein
VEVKRPGNKPTLAQEELLQNVREQGGIAIVAYSVTDLECLVGGSTQWEYGVE